MKMGKRIFATLLAAILLLTGIPLSGFVGLGEELFPVASAAGVMPDVLPPYPEKGHRYWVIFNEGFRNNRLELSSFDVDENATDLRIVWNGSLKVSLSSGSSTRVTQFHYAENEWIYDGEYGILSDRATAVFASNVNVYDNSGNLIVQATDYAGEMPTWERGDIIEFGSYPQSEITDTQTIDALNALEKEWISYGYYSGDGEWYAPNNATEYIATGIGTMRPGDTMQYCDVVYQGNEYRGVLLTQYRPSFPYLQNTVENAAQDVSAYQLNTVYWYLYEPLKWIVLDPQTGFVVSQNAIDAQPFSNTLYEQSYEYYSDEQKTIYANNYPNSSIRSWLTSSFFTTAFSTSEQEAVIATEVQNNAPTELYSAEPTTDPVFLLSADEFEDLDEDYRSISSTDYAGIQGLSRLCLFGILCWNIIWVSMGI